jgi:nucleoside-diphosphate-sugar epimerase
MKKILVLGSEGQIGKPLVRHLTECGFIVDGVDILNSSGLDLRLQTSEIIDKFTNTDFIVF